MTGRYNSTNKARQKKHRMKLFTIKEKLQEAGYRASQKKTDFFLEETTRLGHGISGHGIKQKNKAIVELKPPTSSEEMNSFL